MSEPEVTDIPALLARLDALHAKADPEGGWGADEWEKLIRAAWRDSGLLGSVVLAHGASIRAYAEFIAEAHNEYPTLAAELRRVGELERALEFYVQAEDSGLEDDELDQFSEMARRVLGSPRA